LTDTFAAAFVYFVSHRLWRAGKKYCKEFIGCRFRQQSPRAFPAGGFVLVQVTA
jgi:hypothetical protein